jgi:hypothetical protein
MKENKIELTEKQLEAVISKAIKKDRDMRKRKDRKFEKEKFAKEESHRIFMRSMATFAMVAGAGGVFDKD